MKIKTLSLYLFQATDEVTPTKDIGNALKVLLGAGLATIKTALRPNQAVRKENLLMQAILKTWPAFMTLRHTIEVFSHPWGRFYFTIGRGKPQKPIDQIYFTHRSRILGHFDIEQLVINAGQLPKLHSLSGEESPWQIKPDRWVAICAPPFHRLPEKLFHEGFRGWRYFDLQAYSSTIDSKIKI